MAGLRKHEDAVSEERRRQLAVAKLRRQRRLVEAEEKLSAIDFVLQTAKQNEEVLQARWEILILFVFILLFTDPWLSVVELILCCSIKIVASEP